MNGLPSAIFASTEIHYREVELNDGTMHQFHFKEITAAQIEQYRRLYRAESETNQMKAIPYLISVSLCDMDGMPVLDQEQASNLKPAISDKFASIILDISGFGAEKKI